MKHTGFRAAVLMIAVIVTLGGCSTVFDPNGNNVVDPPLRHNQIHLDVSRPPTADELGMRPDSKDVSFGRVGKALFDVDLALPEGGRLHIPAIAFNASLDNRNDPKVGGEIVVNRVEPSADAALAVLRSEVAGLGLNPADIARLADDIRLTDMRTYGPITTVLTGRRFGYLTFDVEVRLTPDHPSALLNYELTWPAEVLPSWSPSPSRS